MGVSRETGSWAIFRIPQIGVGDQTMDIYLLVGIEQDIDEQRATGGGKI